MTTRLESLEAVARLDATNDNPQLRAMAEQALAHADPPGQVAEDERCLRIYLDAFIPTTDGRHALTRAALSRLAALAHEAVELRQRLVPSGRIAEDNIKARLAMTLNATPDEHKEGADALSRLAAAAQEAETLRARAAALEAQLAGLQEQQDALVAVLGVHPEGETLTEAARRVVAERDAGRAQLKDAERAAENNGYLADERRDLWGQCRVRVRELTAEVEALKARCKDLEKENSEQYAEAVRINKMHDAARAEVDRMTGVYRDEQQLHRQALDEANRLAKELEGVRARCADEQRHISILEENVGLGGGAGLRAVAALIRDGDASAATAKRYPCSPTCTHAAASDPEHPQKVLRLSAEFSKTMDVPLAGGCTCAGEGVCQWCEKRSKEIYAALDRGAEAMRAACWEAVQGQLQACGIYKDSPMWKVIHAAIEGATT